ncbi:MAG: PEGA domain-containing protein [Bacteroidota bacterium]|nr:PEGA domain-containing protein [Bacteroidota bacterium]
MKITLLLSFIIISLSNSFGQTGYIEVQSEPGLSVYLNNVYKGKTTVELSGYIIQKVTPGKNIIRVEKDGYQSYEDNITVKAGEVFVYVVKPLTKEIVDIIEKEKEFISKNKVESQKGKLIIQSLPSKIYITIPQIENVNDYLKAGEWEMPNIPVGKYDITFTFNETVITKTFEISKNETTNIFVNMLSGEYTSKSLNGYSSLMSEGLAFMKSEKYTAAITKFDAALVIRNNDKEATNQKNIALDEIAWDNAFSLYTIQSFETYLKGSANKKYYSEAHTNIKNKLVKTGEKYANDMDIMNMELFLNKYLSNYPTGGDVVKVKQIMCNAYYRKGNYDAQTKTSYAQKEAVTNYQKAEKFCTNKPDLDNKIKVARRLAARYGRPDRFFYSYAYHPTCKIGFSFGSTNNQTVGVYTTARCNATIFNNSNSNGTVDSKGKVTGGQFEKWGNDWRFKNEKRTGTFELLAGITKKIAHPLSIYSGIGFSYNSEAWKMAIYDNLGDYYNTYWVASEVSNTYFAFETGLIMDLNGFHLRTGIATNNFQDARLTVGIGISVQR